MGKCKHHPQSALSGEAGFCSSCLETKLSSVWRGESKPSNSAPATSPLAAPGSICPDSSFHSKEAIAVLGSIASITKRKHSSKHAKGRDITQAAMDFVLDSRYSDGVTSFRRPSPSATTIWGGGHGIRTNNVDGSMSKDVTKRRSKVSRTVVGKSVALAEAKAGVNAFSGARSVGCRSLPLVDRVAKETALRVIREVGDDDDGLSEGDGIVMIETTTTDMNEQDSSVTCFSPSHWQSKLRSRWGLGSPMTGSNKVFPSKSVDKLMLLQAQFPSRDDDSRFVSAGDVDRQRRVSLRQVSNLVHLPSPQHVKSLGRDSESSDVVIEGMPDRILKPEDTSQRLRTSYHTVLKWLQDLPVPETPLQDIGGGEDPYLSSSFVMEIGNKNLAKVGHLHEIAEEHENLPECSVEEEAPAGNPLRDVSSFGKFLIRAAQRKPKQGLSRVASAR